MTKQEQFLWIVQTTILANGITLASRRKSNAEYRDDFSATGVLITANEAIRASFMIPERKNAYEAANEFCTYMSRYLRELEEKAQGVALDVPSSFAQP